SKTNSVGECGVRIERVGARGAEKSRRIGSVGAGIRNGDDSGPAAVIDGVGVAIWSAVENQCGRRADRVHGDAVGAAAACYGGRSAGQTAAQGRDTVVAE